MIANRIVYKLSGSILLFFLGVLLPFGFVINQIFTNFYYQNVQQEIDQTSSKLAQSIAHYHDSMMIDMMQMMAEFSGAKLYIADAQGKIIVNTSLPSITKQGLIPDQELKLLSVGTSIQKHYQDPISKISYLIVGKPIIDQGRFYGGVFVVSSIELIHQSILKIRQLLILSGFGAFFLAVGFTFVLTKKLSNPLIRMEQATRKIAKGNFSIRLDVMSKDEIGSLAAAINDLAVELQRYRDTRSEFFANISHELRTPITYLEGYAKVIKEGLYASEEEKDQYLGIIQKESQRMGRLIYDLFELSKMEAGKFDLDLEWVDLVEIMENLVRNTSLQAKEKGLDIQLNIRDELPLILGDGLRMEQIFMNLLTNAIRYTNKGKIVIDLQRVADRHVLVSMEDTGIGIPQEELKHIFERFYRVEKSRSRQYGGTGLGLAIVKQLVELHGGQIQVHSQSGTGTRFEVRFPMDPVKEEGRK
ncbi:ATP-binding protein [Fodinisporobacter ferrooxydans]|uniref:histidine kinase n=1 Tax=Fodinisporobacter ferrooxydans TaxID=2901836 RepID=A0ABY4CQU2_9BACL|nr:ATP-binding protein [Alicyclobacillaceae bacterium MYW30-H2]